MKNDHKKHHFLPQFYLRNFQINDNGNKEQIYILEKTHSPEKIVAAIKDTGCINNYHTLEFENNEYDKNTVEENLSEIEGIQAKIIKKIIETEKIDKNDDLYILINSLRSRIPKTKKYIEETLRTSVYNVGNIMMENGELPEPPAVLKQKLENGMEDVLKIEIINNILIKYMMDLAFDNNAISILKKMNIVLLKAPEYDFFITSDCPVVEYSSSGHDYDFKRLYDKDIELNIPISEKIMIKLNWKTNKKRLKTVKSCEEYNRRQIINASRYIYSSRINKTIIKMLSKNYNRNSGMNIENINTKYGKYIRSWYSPVI